MTADMDYFVLVRLTDPTYGRNEALRDYLVSNPDVASDMVFDLNIIDDGQPIDYEELQGYLNGISGVDAFRQGMNSWNTCDFHADWFRLTPHGVESMTEEEYKSWCIDTVLEYASEITYDHIIPIPQELQEVLKLWELEPKEVRERYPCKYLNVRPGSKPATSKKAKPKARKPATKKTVQKSSNKRPTAGASKKPAAKPRRTGTVARRSKR